MANVINISNSTQITNFLRAYRNGKAVTQTSGGSQGALVLDVHRTIATHTAGSTVYQGRGVSSVSGRPVYYFSMVDGATSWVEPVDELDIDLSWTSKDEVGVGICAGTCLNDGAAALNDATVTITKGAVSKSATSATGAYSIADIPADTGYTLTVSKAGHTARSYSVDITENATTTQNVVADRNGSIAGTITDETGNVEGATVNAYADGDMGGEVLYTADTEADGTYTLASVEVGTYDIEVVAPNHVTDQTTLLDTAVVANTATTGADAVLGQYADYGGTISDDLAAPIEGAVVEYYSAYPGTPDHTDTTGADGVYAIAGIAPGTWQVKVRATGKVTQFAMDRAVIADADVVNDDWTLITA